MGDSKIEAAHNKRTGAEKKRQAVKGPAKEAMTPAERADMLENFIVPELAKLKTALGKDYPLAVTKHLGFEQKSCVLHQKSDAFLRGLRQGVASLSSVEKKEEKKEGKQEVKANGFDTTLPLIISEVESIGESLRDNLAHHYNQLILGGDEKKFFQNCQELQKNKKTELDVAFKKLEEVDPPPSDEQKAAIKKLQQEQKAALDQLFNEQMNLQLLQLLRGARIYRSATEGARGKSGTEGVLISYGEHKEGAPEIEFAGLNFDETPNGLYIEPRTGQLFNVSDDSISGTLSGSEENFTRCLTAMINFMRDRGNTKIIFTEVELHGIERLIRETFKQGMEVELGPKVWKQLRRQHRDDEILKLLADERIKFQQERAAVINQWKTSSIDPVEAVKIEGKDYHRRLDKVLTERKEIEKKRTELQSAELVTILPEVKKEVAALRELFGSRIPGEREEHVALVEKELKKPVAEQSKTALERFLVARYGEQLTANQFSIDYQASAMARRGQEIVAESKSSPGVAPALQAAWIDPMAGKEAFLSDGAQFGAFANAVKQAAVAEERAAGAEVKAGGRSTG